MHTVVETPIFTRRADALLSAADRADLVALLADDPRAGAVIPMMSDAKGETVDVTAELLQSLEQAVGIMEGRLAPGRVHQVTVPDVDVRQARQRLGMTQAVFAAAFGVSLPTLRKWEQKTRRPEGPARVLLRVIEREPDAVRRALEGGD